MSNTVFFSWQADTETRVGRNLIDRALQEATRRIGDDTNVEEALRDLSIDRDTKDVPGSPPIVDTILQKIDKAAVFVPDLTFVGRRLDGQRPMPNPNVLIEYGWALKALGHSRIVPVMNTAFGEPTHDAMPFNLKHLRNPILYNCPADADDLTRKQARTRLASDLEHALRAVLDSAEFRASLPKPPPPPAFPRREPEGGPGRFRSPEASIGMSSGDRVTPQADVRMPAGPVMWLRVMPEIDPGRKWTVTGLATQAWSNNGPSIEPFCYTMGNGFKKVRGDDGFGAYSPLLNNDYEAGKIVFVFTTGEVWGVDFTLLNDDIYNGTKRIPNVEKVFIENLQNYVALLTKLNIAGPFYWEAGIEDTKGRILYSDGHYPPIATAPVCASAKVTKCGTYSSDDSAVEALRPFFVALFDACGREWPGPQGDR